MKTPTARIDHTTITEAEMRVLRAFRDHMQRHRIWPTLDAAAKGAGVYKSTVRHKITRLIKKGLLAKAETDSPYRSIYLTDLGMAATRKRIKK